MEWEMRNTVNSNIFFKEIRSDVLPCPRRLHVLYKLALRSIFFFFFFFEI